MTTYACVSGQSWSDVVLNTYQTMDMYVKFLNDNNLTPDSLPLSGQKVLWDESLVFDTTVKTQISNNGIKYATLLGFGIPEQINPILEMYKDTREAQYTASANGETTVTITELQGCEIVQVTKEVQPLKNAAFNFNSITGQVTLLGGLSLVAGETLFIIYKKTIT